MTYYLKKLGHQELGSITLPGAKASRGRYIYISKDERVLKFFPPLSKYVKNDSSLLPIIPLYAHSPEKIYCNYIYHNDKHNGSLAARPRDEYRIYLNNALEHNQYLFKTGDIVVIEKKEIIFEEGIQIIYFLDLVSPKSITLYNFCSKIIEEATIRGEHAIYEYNIMEIEDKIQRLLTSPLETVVDSSVTAKLQSSDTKIEDLFSATSFRDFTMTGYENKCAITGTVIKCGNFLNLEAAHIKPKSHGGPFLPNNGIALSRDIHWAFDKGFITLKDDFKILVHNNVQSDFLQYFNGKSIFVPTNEFFKPSVDSIKYHRENVFGLFLTSGRL